MLFPALIRNAVRPNSAAAVSVMSVKRNGCVFDLAGICRWRGFIVKGDNSKGMSSGVTFLLEIMATEVNGGLYQSQSWTRSRHPHSRHEANTLDGVGSGKAPIWQPRSDSTVNLGLRVFAAKGERGMIYACHGHAQKHLMYSSAAWRHERSPAGSVELIL